jgi:DNA-binding CsgD family transcriptional regulator
MDATMTIARDGVWRSVFCCLGLALLFATDWCFDLARTVPVETNGTLLFYLPGTLASAVFGACAILHRRIGGFLNRKQIVLCLGVLATLGRLLQAFGGLLAPAALYGGLSLCGVAESILLLLWISRCCELKPQYSQIAFPAAYLLVAIVYFILLAVEPWLITVLLCLFPLASSALLCGYARWLQAAEQGTVEGIAVDPSPAWSFPVHPVLLMIIYHFVFFFSLSLTSGPSLFGHFGMLLIAIFALCATLLFFDRFSPSLLYRLALPLLVAGLLLQSWLHTGAPVATLLSNASNIGFDLFILMTLSSICYRYQISALWMFGMVEAFSSLAALAGWVFGSLFTAANPVGSQEANIAVALIVVVLIAISILFFDDRIVSNAFGSEPIGKQTDRKLGETSTIMTAMTYYEEFVWRCGCVARRHGLTHREEEVLEMLAQGFDISRIERELFIANSTAKTHIRHIYEKTGVHARSELRKLVEEVGLP